MSDETGQGNELESLKYVLNEYISINDLKSKIDIIDSNALNYYQSNRVTFCNDPVIGGGFSKDFYTNYKTNICCPKFISK